MLSFFFFCLQATSVYPLSSIYLEVFLHIFCPDLLSTRLFLILFSQPSTCKLTSGKVLTEVKNSPWVIGILISLTSWDSPSLPFSFSTFSPQFFLIFPFIWGYFSLRIWMGLLSLVIITFSSISITVIPGISRMSITKPIPPTSPWLQRWISTWFSLSLCRRYFQHVFKTALIFYPILIFGGTLPSSILYLSNSSAK